MPTNLTVNLVYDNTTDANFRAWGSGISTALSTLGWIQTADTGQINWTTVLKPTGAANFPGFEVWKGAASANQTACPIFFRIDYGSSSSGQGIPALKVTFGTSSNGSGTIGGQSISAITMNGTAAAAGATQFPCYFYGDGSKWAAMLWDNNTAGRPMLMGIERNLSSAGVEGGTYYTILLGWTNTTYNQITIFASGSPVSTPTVNCWVQIRSGDASTTLAYNGNAPCMPVFPCPGYIDYPMTIFMTLKQADATNGASFTTNNWYGGSHTYQMSFNQLMGSINNTGNNQYGATAMRYE